MSRALHQQPSIYDPLGGSEPEANRDPSLIEAWFWTQLTQKKCIRCGYLLFKNELKRMMCIRCKGAIDRGDA